MKKILPFTLLTLMSLLFTFSAYAQTSVSATITDAGGQAWTNGTYTFTSFAAGQAPITGTLNGSGAFTSVSFPHNRATADVGDIWTARICPDATSGCFTKTVTISGATQSLSSTLIPPAIAITIPAYPAPLTGIRAYADAEIVSTPKGGQYYNTTSDTERQCTAVTGTTCTSWTSAGGGFNSPLTTLGDIIIEDASPTPIRLPGPTTPNGVVQVLTDTPSGGVAQAETWGLSGVPTNAQVGTSYTIAVTDRASYVTFSNAGAIAVTLPQANSAGFGSNFVFVACDIGAGTATITPTISTISYSNGSAYTSAASSMALITGQCAWIYSDNSNYFAIQRTSGVPIYPTTVSGTINSGGVPYFSSGTQESSSAVLSSNVLVKGGGAGAAPANSSVTDNGTTVSTSDSGGYVAAVFVANGATAGFVSYPQGSTSAAIAPCNVATSICEQAPTAVTSYLVNKPGVAAQGTITNVVTAAVDTQGFSGDTNHSTTVTIGSGTSIGSTQLCSTTNCPVGTYRVNVYIDITTACGTSGTYIVNLIYTDDQGSKTVPMNINGTGAVPATGTLTTTSTANFGEDSQIIRSTGAASINYSTTAVACGTAGPMVGKLYLSVEPVQ